MIINFIEKSAENYKFNDILATWSIILTILAFVYLFYKYNKAYGNIFSDIFKVIKNFFSLSEIDDKYPNFPENIDESNEFKSKTRNIILFLFLINLITFYLMNKYFKSRWDIRFIHIKMFDNLINFKFDRIMIFLLWALIIISYILPIGSLYFIYYNRPLWFFTILGYCIPGLMRIFLIDKEMQYKLF